MISRGTRRRFSSVALVLLATLLIGGIAAPIIVSVQSNRISVASSSLVAAPRDSIIITSPMPFGVSKLVTVERGSLYPAGPTGRALDLPLSRAQLDSGATRFVIENGSVRLSSGDGDIVAEQSSPLLDAISKLNFETIFLRKTALAVRLPDGHVETLTDVDGEVTQRRKSSLTLKGRGELRGQRVTIDATIGLVPDQRGVGGAPMKVAVKSAMLELAFDGRAVLTEPVHLSGAVEFKSPQLRALGRWFGMAWPAGTGLRNFTANGQMEWAGPALVVSRAVLGLDGNEATGTLNLNFAGARPFVGGTLALKSLDLGRYFPLPAAIEAATPAAAPLPIASSLRATDLSVPLAQHVDADLRISADKVVIGRLPLGRSAAAVTIANGRLLADVGAFEFEGGRGSGQFSTDMTGSIPRVTVRGRLDDVDAQRFSMALFGHPVLTGKGTFTADVASQGRTGEDLLAVSHGKISIDMRSGGRLGVDLRALANASQRQAVDGWGAASKGAFAFDEFSGLFSVRAGTLLADNVKALAGDSELTLHGQVDVPAARLNASLLQMAPAAKGAASSNGVPVLSLQIFGPWLKPSIRNETGRGGEPSAVQVPSSARF